MSNLDTAKLVRQVADIYLAAKLGPLPETPTSAGPSRLSATELAGKGGVYFCPVTAETLLLEFRDGKLVIPIGSGLELAPVTTNRFRLVVAPEVEFQFVESPAGSISVRQTAGSGQPVLYEAKTSVHPSREELADYVGRYHSDELVLHQRKFGDAQLQPTFADAFKCDLTSAMRMPHSMDILFHRDAHRIAGFTISSGRIRNVRFSRMS